MKPTLAAPPAALIIILACEGVMAMRIIKYLGDKRVAMLSCMVPSRIDAEIDRRELGEDDGQHCSIVSRYGHLGIAAA